MKSKIGDHYIPDGHNAHINTKVFEGELNNLFSSLSGKALEDANLWSEAYQLILNRISNLPDEPRDGELICRYLTPTKFLWFANQNSVYFGGADNFEDKYDSNIPLDYKNSVLKFLHERNALPLEWDDYLVRMRSHWLISCWTSLDSHIDDYLLWHRYAGNEYGIGIVTTYGALKKILESSCSDETDIESFTSGYVRYKSPLCLPPFNKRNMFRNEKEVRFACKTKLLASHAVDISILKNIISLRFSPDAPQEHIDAVLAIWIKMGGGDEYHISGE